MTIKLCRRNVHIKGGVSIRPVFGPYPEEVSRKQEEQAYINKACFWSILKIEII
jgi:hypothetical protein